MILFRLALPPKYWVRGQGRMMSDPNLPFMERSIGMQQFVTVATIGSTVAWLLSAMTSRRSGRRVFRSLVGD
jgi:hypothetical protein